MAHYKAHHDWESDGKPTGIKDDAEFYAIQRAVYKEVIYFVKKEKLDYKAIASRLYDYLKSLPNGTELSTHEALDKLFGKPQVQYKDYNGCTYFYGGIVIKEDDFWDIHDSLMGKSLWDINMTPTSPSMRTSVSAFHITFLSFSN